MPLREDWTDNQELVAADHIEAHNALAAAVNAGDLALIDRVAALEEAGLHKAPVYSGWVEARGNGVSLAQRHPIVRYGYEPDRFTTQGTGIIKGSELSFALGTFDEPPIKAVAATVELFDIASGSTYGIQADEDLVGIVAWDSSNVTWSSVYWGSGPTLSVDGTLINVTNGLYGYSFTVTFVNV